MKVNALIGGTQKGGTTALFDFLSKHPQVEVPKDGAKELHFFDNEKEFKWPWPNYRKYENAFKAPSNAKIRLEATPIYLFWKPAPKRIAKYNPMIKMIFLLRDPVARAYSQWEMEFSRGDEKEPFERAIELEKQFLIESPKKQDRVRSYISRGFYGAQTRRLLRYFDPRQLLFLKTDHLLTSHEKTLDFVCSFLEIEQFSVYPEKRIVLPTNKDPTLPKLPPFLEDSLRREYRADLRELNELTGLEVQDWLE